MSRPENGALSNHKQYVGFFSPSAPTARVLGRGWTLTVLFLGFLLSAFVSFVGPSVLRDEFFYDANTIAKVGHTAVEDRVGDEGSFAVIADFYKAIGLIDHPLLAGLFGVALGAVVIGLAIWRAGGLRCNLFSLALVSSAFLLNGVFLGQFTKEIMISMVVALVVGLPRNKRADLVIICAMILVSAEFRMYWALLLVVYLGFRFLLSPRIQVNGRSLDFRKPWVTITAIVLASVVFSLAIGIYTGDSGDHFRTSVNEVRLGDGSTATLIPRYVAGEGQLVGILNNLLTMVFMVIPMPLLALMRPYYLASALLIFALWANVFLGFRKLKVSTNTWALRAFALMVGFLVAQGVFEPDYGSALRHLAPLVPALILLHEFPVNEKTTLGKGN